jgi:hypothetical protein
MHMCLRKALRLHAFELFLQDVFAKSRIVRLDDRVVNRNRQEVGELVALFIPAPLLLLDVATRLLAFPPSLLVIRLQTALLRVCDDFAHILVIKHRHTVLGSSHSDHFKLVVARAGLPCTARVDHLLNHFSSDMSQS